VPFFCMRLTHSACRPDCPALLRHGAPRLWAVTQKHFRRTQRNMGRNPKPDIVVTVIGIVVVAIGRARVVGIVVPGAATQDPGALPDAWPRGFRSRHSECTGICVRNLRRSLRSQNTPNRGRKPGSRISRNQCTEDSEIQSSAGDATRNPRSTSRATGSPRR
jgi:hypothetical protein